MLVKDLMTTSVSAVRPDDTIETAVKIMRGENIGIVPVCDIQKHVLGVVTDRYPHAFGLCRLFFF